MPIPSPVNKRSTLQYHSVRRMMRFASVGAFCTVLSLGLNYVFLRYVGTRLIPTYVVVYAATILISFALNSQITFDAKFNLTNVLLYFGIYLSSMGLGVVLILLYRSVFNFENWVYPFMATPLTMLWNYHWSVRLLKKHEI